MNALHGLISVYTLPVPIQTDGTHVLVKQGINLRQDRIIYVKVQLHYNTGFISVFHEFKTHIYGSQNDWVWYGKQIGMNFSYINDQKAITSE